MSELLAITQNETASVSLLNLLICVLVALGLGLVLSAIHGFHNRTSRSLSITLALLPAIVCVVIAMVNGNLGAGVAVAGAFSLVRFRSAPGSGKDICFVFLAMAVGLVCGMEYLDIACVITLVIGGAYLLYQFSGWGVRGERADRVLRVTVPEDLDYVGLFDDLLAQYTTYHELVSVKTTNMGSLYRLVYNVGMKDTNNERELIDAVRCRNGNLEVSLSHQEEATDAL